MTGQHVHEQLGAYVLGALPPAERHAVEAHLPGCDSCREELASLSAMPPLLSRLSLEEATADLPGNAVEVLPGLLAEAAAERRRLRRRVVRWRIAFAGAAAAAVGFAAPWPSGGPDGAGITAAPVAADAADASGTASTFAWEWGTTVQLALEDLPRRERYVLWAVAADGRREQAGTWGPTSDGGARVRGASSIPREELAAVEVATRDGEVLVRFDLPEEAGGDGSAGGDA